MGADQEVIDVPADFRDESPFHGAVDGLDSMAGIRGWVVAREDPDRLIAVEAVYDGRLIGSVKATSGRSDIAKLLGHDLDCGFTFKWTDFDSELVLRLAQKGDGAIRFVVGHKRYGLVCLHGDITLGEIADRVPRPACTSYGPGGKASFVDALKSRGRIAVIASFTSQRFVLSYHRSLIDRLAGGGYVVMMVHSEGRRCLNEEAATIENLSCLIRRGNSGYDFASWAEGIGLLAAHWQHLDELLLINDSNFGKVDRIFPVLAETPGEFICLTDSYETSYHAQSYFLLFRKGALREGGLLEFFDKYGFPAAKEDVIRLGELRLTAVMQSGGFELTPLCPYERVAGQWLDELPKTIDRVRDIYHHLGLWRQEPLEDRLESFAEVAEAIVNNKPINPSHFFWRPLIRHFNHPFVKRELIMKNPGNVPDLLLAFLTNETADILDRAEVLQYARIEGGSPMIDRERRLEDAKVAEGTGSRQRPEQAA